MPNRQTSAAKSPPIRKTYDCPPTLDDNGVLEFCKKGFLLLEGVVDDDTNKRTIDFVDSNTGMEPLEILDEEWFVDSVIKNPQGAGAVRSLLGKDFGIPILMSNHRIQTPQPAQEWHVDGAAKFGPELNYLQVFYLPQECTREMGPTELLPGSHFLFSNRDAMKQIGRIRGAFYASAPAGSIVITHYGIWHRRSESTVVSLRNNLKYNYWRRSAPKRDWLTDPGFDVATADYTSPAPTYRQQFRDTFDSAEMYLWRRGDHEKFDLIGGQAWPLPGRRNDLPYGIPRGVR